MRLEIRGEYPPDWPAIARAVKEAAGWRCVRCRHPFTAAGAPLACDGCDPQRCPMLLRGRMLNYGVHHLDGDKSNCRWWNLLATCNSCHLTVQAKVIPERPYLWPHSEWFRPYVAGFYAWYYGGREVTREEAIAELEELLALGQPWRAA
jgi:hypothetical protein